MKVTKNRYLLGFSIVVLLLALVRLLCPSVASVRGDVSDSLSVNRDTMDARAYSLSDSVDKLPLDAKDANVLPPNDSMSAARPSLFFHADGSLVKNRILSVPNFGRAFPDQNDVQLVVASKWGVRPVENRDEAERLKGQLVYIGSNPYFYVDRLRSSIPYLVPRAAELLQDIGFNFYDSLQIKGVPLHKLIVTSVLRTKEDVRQLRSHNGNATQNSCHMYGTTFDVCYNRYKTIETSSMPRWQVRNDTLKWVLSEVLRDMRQSNRCYIKYEVHQGCFHITVR